MLDVWCSMFDVRKEGNRNARCSMLECCAGVILPYDATFDVRCVLFDFRCPERLEHKCNVLDARVLRQCDFAIRFDIRCSTCVARFSMFGAMYSMLECCGCVILLYDSIFDARCVLFDVRCPARVEEKCKVLDARML